ncbi:MAG: hypothetical protein GXZ08_01350 [Tissierellia bacterium]|nr:hypothetical protein [Tissierellia bacterium]
MNKKVKKAAVVAMSAVILMQSSAVMAKSFPDVTKSGQYGWAYEYVDEMSNKGVITGYEDGTFKPGNNVTYLETLKLISGVINPSKTEISEALETYKSVLSENSVPEWAKEAVAVCLKRGATNESEVKMAAKSGMIEVGTNKRIDRMTISVYLARALELEPKTVTSLKYKDASSINKDFVNLIAALIDTGVLHEDGRDGYFDPDKPVRRSEVAKMIKIAYDYVAKNPLSGSAIDTSNLKAEKGDVVSITEINNKNHLVFKADGETKAKAVIVTSSTKITDKKNNTLKVTDIVEGQTITVKVNPNNNEAAEVVIEEDTKAIEGTITGINTSKETLEIKYTVNGISQTKVYDVDSNAKITIDGKTARFRDIERDHIIEFHPNAKMTLSEVKILTKSNKKADYEFVDMGKEDALWNGRSLSVKDKSGRSVSLVLESGAYVYNSNGKRIDPEDLRKGDQLKLTFASRNDQLVTRIDIVDNYYSANTNVDYELRNFSLGSVSVKLWEKGTNDLIGDGAYSLLNTDVYVDGEKVRIDRDTYNLKNVADTGTAKAVFSKSGLRGDLEEIYFTSKEGSKDYNNDERVVGQIKDIVKSRYGYDVEVEYTYNRYTVTRSYSYDKLPLFLENLSRNDKLYVYIDKNGNITGLSSY